MNAKNKTILNLIPTNIFDRNRIGRHIISLPSQTKTGFTMKFYEVFTILNKKLVQL